MTRVYSLQDLELLLRVAETGNMSEVARQLNITNAAVSASIKRLEAALGVSLFERTTRTLKLSSASESFIPQIQQVLSALDVAENELRNLQLLVAGEIRIGLPSDLGRNFLLDIFDDFQALHPNIKLVLHFSDFLQDLHRDNLDLVIRYGEQKDSGLIARKLGDNSRVIVASPEYIRNKPAIESLEDLANHNCILFYRNDRPYAKWAFVQNGKSIEIAVGGNRNADDGEVVKRWAVAGKGVAYKSRIDVQRELANGELKEVMAGQYEGQASPVYAVYKERKYQPYRLTALLNHLEQEVKAKTERVNRNSALMG